MSQQIRLQKYLSQSWVCSRRKAEEFIKDGQVFVNWNIAHIGMSINPDTDIIKLGEQALQTKEQFVYYKFYKPRWIETTCAQRGGKSIVDIINTQERVFPVWRLDKDSTWLILLTDDGRITNYLTHPRYEHEKEYIVEVFWSITDSSLALMSRGVPVLWSNTLPCRVDRISSWKFRIILKEWRNRQIRRMVEYTWWKVKKLKRIRVENISLGDMIPWELKRLSEREKNKLFQIIWKLD